MKCDREAERGLTTRCFSLSNLQVNVFVLGRTYLRLIRQLHLQLPLIDPSFYISRFAALLEFGDETQRVALDASRLVARFKMDWMQEGRRPAGICGACLLLAARMNHFRRSISEIVQVVKIADVTLRKRLEEFKATPSGQLTVEDFRNVWLEEEYDPPAFYQAKLPKKEKRKNKVKREKGKKVKRDLDSALATDGLGGNDADAEDEQDDHEERNTKRVRRSVSPKGKGRTTSHRFETGPHQADDADNSIDAEDESVDQRPDPVLDPQLEVLADQGVEAEIGVYLAEDAARALDETLEQQERERRSRAIAGQVVPIAGTTTAPTSSAQDAKHASQEVIKQSQSTIRSMLSGDTVDDGTSDALAESPVTGVPPSLKNEGVTGDIEERVANDPLVGLDEAELDCFILNDDEVRIKERVWMEFNKDYLEILAGKSTKYMGTYLVKRYTLTSIVFPCHSAKQLKLEADQKAGIKPATKVSHTCGAFHPYCSCWLTAFGHAMSPAQAQQTSRWQHSARYQRC